MPTFQIWIKKTVLGPQGPIELGLGGTHDVTCEAYQVAAERRALFLSYEQEVNRLLERLKLGLPIEPQDPPLKSQERSESRSESRPEPRDDARIPAGKEARASTRPEPPPEPPTESLEAQAEHEAVSLERSRLFLAELQERLARRGRQKEQQDPTSSRDPLSEPVLQAEGSGHSPSQRPVQAPLIASSSPERGDPELPPESMAHLLIPREGI